MRFDDTIYALASAPGKAAVALVRVSGKGAAQAVRELSEGGLPAPRQAVLRKLVDPRTGEQIDRALVLWFPGPASYCGEDMAEFHLHGGRAVIAAILRVLGDRDGLRPAEAGEFSRRAFENGKLDLTAAEGIADLVDAETDIQRHQALRQSGGALAEFYNNWRQKLEQIRALVETDIDFSDQELPDDVLAPVAAGVRDIASEISRHLQDGGWGERLRDGIQIVIIGPVNAGKSSLINYLAGRDAAIVGPEGGTTRDIIEVRLDLAGWPVNIADTAGLRDVSGGVEAEGIRRTRARAQAADLKIILFDGARWPELDDEAEAQIDDNAIVVLNKIDLLPEDSGAVAIGDAEAIKISCMTGEGIDELLDRIKYFLETRYRPSASPILTRARHRHALENCLAALQRYDANDGSELAAEELRLAANALGRITGRVDIEKLLDIIFMDFCIGK